MLSRLKTAIRNLTRLRNWLFRIHQKKQVRKWIRKGRPVPPPHAVKQELIRKYARRHSSSIFVETGTYYGDMIEAMKDSFAQLYSIELSRRLFEKAKQRFSGCQHIRLFHGDSGRQIAQVLPLLDRATLFWLDGHFSAGVTARGEKDTPIFEELEHILGAPDLGHVVIIDDARCFGAEQGYPTLEALKSFIFSRRPYVQIHTEQDSIIVAPSKE